MTGSIGQPQLPTGRKGSGRAVPPRPTEAVSAPHIRRSRSPEPGSSRALERRGYCQRRSRRPAVRCGSMLPLNAEEGCSIDSKHVDPDTRGAWDFESDPPLEGLTGHELTRHEDRHRTKTRGLVDAYRVRTLHGGHRKEPCVRDDPLVIGALKRRVACRPTSRCGPGFQSVGPQVPGHDGMSCLASFKRLV
jgi:hypothetical protein